MNVELMPLEPAAGASWDPPSPTEASKAVPGGWWDPALGNLRIDEGTLGVGMAGHAYAAVPTSVSRARRFAVACLAEWGMPAAADDLGLIVSELVGNACRHAVTGRIPSHTRVLLQLRPLPSIDAVVCMVSDPETRGPAPAPTDRFAESGRGLGLVAAFSREWGWNTVGGQGKVVWAICGSEPR
ncbi:ATP-binding protein [Nocardiopsis alba]|jgi:hypothetical protein|uniref:ATP-binding protein n=1 Tax=Nocardiopsis alba TaxID=53437 RepID=UPI0033AC1748